MKTYHGTTKEAISAHYDVDNAFYATWLDETMTYSCALWEEFSDATLLAAQMKKLNFHIDNVVTTNCPNILDIGCGWGSLIDRLITRFRNAKVDGLTLSGEQYNYMLDKYSSNKNVGVYLESWEHHTPKHQYDGIVSIGAFEHFIKCGLPRELKVEIYRDFFNKCSSMLKPKAKISLQTIVYENYNEDLPNNFVEEIFPESDLPRLADIMLAIERKFELISHRNDRLHYMKTLQCWYSNLLQNKELIIKKYGEALFEKYQKYLGIFIFGFKTGTVNLSRMVLQKL